MIIKRLDKHVASIKIIYKYSHNFHSECIKEWLSKNKKECPVCRTNIAPKDVPTNPIAN